MTCRDLYTQACSRSGKAAVSAELVKLGLRDGRQIDNPGDKEAAIRELLSRLAGVAPAPAPAPVAPAAPVPAPAPAAPAPAPVAPVAPAAPAPAAGPAERLHQLGYDIVAIRPAEKRPFEKGWTQRPRLTLEDARRIDRDGKSVGIRTGAAPGALVFTIGLDLDILDPSLAAEITQHAVGYFGPTPIRTGRAPKALLPYRTDEPLRKHRLAFLAAGAEHAVELIATGLQFVAAGIHPDTQKPYIWGRELPPAAELTSVTGEQIRDYFSTVLPVWLASRGIEPTSTKSGIAVDRSGVDQKSLLAPSINDLRTLVEEIDNDSDYDKWVTDLIAIKASAGPEHEPEAFEIALEYSDRHPEPTTPDDLRAKWDSLHPPFALGWSYLLDRARRQGVNTASYDFEAIEPAPPATPTTAAATESVPHAVARMNDRYVYMLDGIYCRDDHTIRAADKVRGFHANNPGDFATWSTHPARASARRLTFDPTLPPFTITPDGDFNAWPGFALTPSPGGSDERILHHLRENISGGDEGHYQWVMMWLASMIQNPIRRPGTALMLRGPQGSGKTTLFVLMQKILGPRLCHMASQSDEVTAKYNDHLEGRVLLGSEEALFAGDRRGEGLLKTMVTSPDLTVEPKFAPRRVTPNLLHLLMTTNASWGLPAGESERRFCVLHLNNPSAQDRIYFKALYDEIEHGGAERFMYRLLHETLINWDVISHPLATEALLEQQEDSMTDLTRAWYTFLISGQVPGGLNPTPENVLDAFRGRLSDPFERKRLTANKLGRFLNEAGVEIERMPPAQGRRRVYKFPPLADARAAFAAKLAVTPEWEPAEDWQQELEALVS